MRNFLAIILFLVTYVSSSPVIGQIAQNYPVQGTASVGLPAPTQMEVYANAATNPIQLDLVLTDTRFQFRTVYLQMQMTGPGLSVISQEPQLTFDLRSGVVSRVPANVMASYFTPQFLRGSSPALFQNPLPSGVYTFSFKVIDAFSGAEISDDIQTFPTWVEMSDPPLPLLPDNYSGIEATQVQNVVFQWLPRHTPSNQIEYEFTLTELPVANRGNIQNIFLSQPPIFKTTVSQPYLLYDAKFPPLRQGGVYAWRVQVKGKLGSKGKVGEFVNQGFSEIFSFLYEKPTQKLNPPRDVEIAWSPDFNRTYYKWKGDENHFKYIVTKSTVQDVFNSEGEKIGTKLVEREQFEVNKEFEDITNVTKRLRSEGEVYTDWTFTVRAVDLFGRESEAVTVELPRIGDNDTFVTQQEKLLTLKGEVDAYFRTYTAGEGQSINRTGVRNTFFVKEAEVCFYVTNEEVTSQKLEDFRFNRTKARLITCAKTDEQGKYELSSDYLKVANLSSQFYYLTIQAPSAHYSDVVTQIAVPDEGGRAVRNLAKQTLLTNTFRVEPNFIWADGAEVEKSLFESIYLYRPKASFEANKELLSHEKSTSIGDVEVRFNKEKYVRVGDLLAESQQFFGNSLLSDHFLIGVKMPGEDEKLFPLNPVTQYKSIRIDQKNAYENSIPIISQRVNYTPPLVRIYGNVAARVRGEEEGGVPASDWEVGILVPSEPKDIRAIDATGKMNPPSSYAQVHWEEILTDENGNYELYLPSEIFFNQDVDDVIIYTRIPGVYAYSQAVRIPKPLANVEVNLNLQSTGAAIASVLKDQHGDPVKAAKLTHSSGAFTSTNEKGEFILPVQFSPSVEKDPIIQVVADGYLVEDIELENFEKVEFKEVVEDYGSSFWTSEIEKIREKTKSEFTELGNEDWFRNNFRLYNTTLQDVFSLDSIGVESIEHIVKIRTYRTVEEGDTKVKEYLNTSLELEGEDEALDVPIEGVSQILKKKGTKLVGTVRNKSKTEKEVLLEKEFTLNFRSPLNKLDTVHIDIEVKDAILVAGVVTGFRTDSSKIGGVGGLTISSEGLEDVETDSTGNFEIWLEKDAIEVTLELSHKGFNDVSYSFTTQTITEEDRVKNFLNNEEATFEYITEDELRELDLAIYERDEDIPEFKKLQNFPVAISVAKKVDDNTFLITGTLNLTEDEYIYKLEKGEELTFEDIEVTQDENDEENAILVEDEVDLDQETLALKMFDFAPVESMSEHNGTMNAIKLAKLKTDDGEAYGKIGGKRLIFKPKSFLKKTPDLILQEIDLLPELPNTEDEVGFNNDITDKNKAKLLASNAKREAKDKEGKYAVEDEKKEKKEEPALKKFEETESEGEMIPVFVSGKKKLSNFQDGLQFQLKFAEDLNGVERRDIVDEDGESTGKKERMSMSLGYGFSMLIDESKKATLSKGGVEFSGNLAFPMMKLIGIEGIMPMVEKLVLSPNEELSMRELRLAQMVEEGADPYYVRLGVANSWRFEINKIQVFDDFSNAGIGGKLFTDKTNHLIVHSMAVRKANGSYYPFLDMEFPKQGFKIKSLLLKSPEEQHILLGYNFEDEAYEIDAGVRIEAGKGAGSMMKKILPLEVEKFVYNTAGKFYLAVKPGKTVQVGPVKINIRKIIVNKGGAVSWDEMLLSLRRNKEENDALNKTQNYNNANYRTLNKKRVINRDSNVEGYEFTEEGGDIELAEGEVDWAIGIAGGVQVDKLKGVDVKGDASFVFGEREGEFDIQFNSIDMVMSSTAFKAYMSVELSTSGDRVGFEGKGEVDTMTRRWGGAFKFYSLPTGIEFGIAIKASTYGLITGPVMWTSVGGGIDINTATNKYQIFFLGSATTPGTNPRVSELRNIRVEVSFDTNECGAKPVVKGSGDWYKNEELFCSANMMLDFCKTVVLANINCTKELIEGSEANIQATIYLTPGSVFVGANVKTVVLGMNANAVFALGVNAKLIGSEIPREVAAYRGELNTNYLEEGQSKLNGIYLGAALSLRKEGSGDYGVFAWSAEVVMENKAELFKSFSNKSFAVSNDFKLNVNTYARIGTSGFNLSAYGKLDIRVLIAGGYNETVGWNFNGTAGLNLEIGNNMDVSCNSFNIKMCEVDVLVADVPYPCSLDWKFCVQKMLSVRYNQKGSNSGWKYEL
ncbi:MAG: hypothetical protein ACK4R6_12490 [Spirosomataceae bacterium]